MITNIEKEVIQNLLDISNAAYWAMDSTCQYNDEDEYMIPESDVLELSEELDKLDVLPDDQPGYTMHGPAKAKWLLRNLLK